MIMQKVIVMPRTLKSPTKAIRIDSTPTMLLLKINKQYVGKFLKRMLLLLLAVGYSSALVISYKLDGILFSVLVKMGTIIGFLLFMAFQSKKQSH